MKILYFHQHFATPSGNGGTRSYEMARRLIKNGHQVTIVCGAYQNSLLDLKEISKGLRHGMVDGIEVYQFELPYSNKDSFFKRSMLFLKYARKSTWLALKLKYDLIFCTSTPLTAGIPGIFASILKRKKFVFEVRDLWPELPKAMGVITNPLIIMGMSILEWMSYRSSKACVGLSPGIVEGIKKRS